jgi:hypothetical protein
MNKRHHLDLSKCYKHLQKIYSLEPAPLYYIVPSQMISLLKFNIFICLKEILLSKIVYFFHEKYVEALIFGY